MGQPQNSRSRFVEQSVFLPEQLWTRVREAAESRGKDDSEIIADALRLLLYQDATGTPASVGGTLPSHAGRAPLPSPRIANSIIETLLQDVTSEPISSAKLRERLLEVMTTVEEKDHFINRHSESVADLARRTAEALGLAEQLVQAVELAAIAHDIGKSRVPENVLGKRGRLDADEWALVKQYPVFGGEIVEGFEKLGALVPIVRHHQERWDGSGYPDGLVGDAIPLGAQIVGLCDVYDVLTSDRAYRPALPSDAARQTIEGGIGRHWNPAVARIFLDKVLRG